MGRNFSSSLGRVKTLPLPEGKKGREGLEEAMDGRSLEDFLIKINTSQNKECQNRRRDSKHQ